VQADPIVRVGDGRGREPLPRRLLARTGAAPAQQVDAALPVCLCGSTRYSELISGTYDRLLLRDYEFRVVQCLECGLARTVPIPDPHQYERGCALTSEGGSFVGSHDDMWSDSIAEDVQKRFGVGRLLDVGCHVGNLVAAAEARGFDAEGIDLDPVATAEGRRLGRRVRTASIEEVEETFDFVVMNQVLEHVFDVRGLLSNVARVLVPGGHLYVLVPYHRGLMPRLMKDRWMGWFPSQHVWHFIPGTLTRVVCEASQLRPFALTTKGVIEPPSVGFKGQVKAVVTVLSRTVGWGDQIEAFFQKPREGEVIGR
jgi:SAM-dependent methyltransferase